jgi:hypothetical protein
MVGTRTPGKGQNMEINEKKKLVRNVYKYQKISNMFRIRIFLDETECVLNEKMMPDVTVIVPPGTRNSQQSIEHPYL